LLAAREERREEDWRGEERGGKCRQF